MWFKTSTPQGGYNNGGHLYRHRAPSNDVIILLNDSPQKYISCQIHVGATNGIVEYNVNYSDGSWHYFVLTYNGAIVKMFYDGVEVASSSFSQNFNWDTNFIREDIGDNPYDGDTRGFIGIIDEVKIYSRALSQAEIQADMTGITTTTTTTGTIVGKVTKADGTTAISGVTVEVLQIGVLKSSTSIDSTGNYSIALASGTYDVRVSASGYTTQTKTGISVSANQTTTVDFALVSNCNSDKYNRNNNS